MDGAIQKSALTPKKGKPSVNFLLQTDFTVRNGKLAVCVPPGVAVGSPIEAFVRLYLLRDREALLIRHMSDLKGQVRIDSPKAALSFARLFTSPRTFYLFDPPKILPGNQADEATLEVIAYERMDVGYLFGDKSLYDNYHGRLGGGNGFAGIITSARASALQLPIAASAAAGSGFLTMRAIAVQDRSRKAMRPALFQVQERIGPDGSYKIERVTPLPARTAEIATIMFPVYR